MKKLGEGWQYTVYDLENGRVRKIYNSALRSTWIILKDLVPGEMKGIAKIPEYIPDLKQKARLSFELLKRKNLPAAWFGNPTFLNKFDYEQDKILPLHVAFEKGSVGDAKKLIDQFILFNQQLIQHDIADKFFNISKNFGLNERREMVLADIGELIEQPKIAKQIRERIWAVPYKLKWIRNDEVRAYFVERMDQHLGKLSR